MRLMKNNVFAIVITSFLICSCSNLSNPKSEKNGIDSINFFKAIPPKKGKIRAYPTALNSGYLVLKNNCIYLTNRKNSDKNLRIIQWPWNYSLKSDQTGIHIMDGKEQVAATIGGFVKLGGSGSGFKRSSSTPSSRSKYLICMTENVIGAWGASPNF